MRTLFLLQLALLIGLVSVPAYAYDHVASDVPVGVIRVFGNSAGVEVFTRSDGASFAGCTMDAASMWIDSNYVTADGVKAITALLIAAKASQALVRVYYATADGYCRFQIVEME